MFEEEEEEDWPAGLPMLWLMKSSPMDFCLSGSAPRPPLWGLGILTGEPLMLTKALMLATDLFTGRFSPAEVPQSPLPSRPERTGEPRLLAGDGGAKSLFGEGGTAGVRDGEEGVGGWDFPPSRKPLPLNGIVFLMSCDPEPAVALGGFSFSEDFFSEVFPFFLPSFLPFLPYPSGSLTLV